MEKHISHTFECLAQVPAAVPYEKPDCSLLQGTVSHVRIKLLSAAHLQLTLRNRDRANALPVGG